MIAARNSKPLLVGSLIPLWGIAAFAGMQQFAGTRALPWFLAVMAALFLGLFSYVASGAVRAHRARRAHRRAV